MMGQTIEKLCICCGGITHQERKMEPESRLGDYDFIYICLRCEGQDDFLIKELPPGQQTL